MSWKHTRTNLWMETIELLLGGLQLSNKQKVEVDNADIERFFIENGYLNERWLWHSTVVTIIGHVDRSKTTALRMPSSCSHLRQSEAGDHSIYRVLPSWKMVEDSPSLIHQDAAFASMHCAWLYCYKYLRSWSVTADDGVMPQTIETHQPLKTCNVPNIVAAELINRNCFSRNVIGELAERSWCQPRGGDSEFIYSFGVQQNIEENLLKRPSCSAIQNSRQTSACKSAVVEARRMIEEIWPSCTTKVPWMSRPNRSQIPSIVSVTMTALTLMIDHAGQVARHWILGVWTSTDSWVFAQVYEDENLPCMGETLTFPNETQRPASHRRKPLWYP